MKNFRTYDLALQFYRLCSSIADDGTQDPIWKDQFKRASLSILLNIAEGSGKATAKDRKKFYTIAMGSLRESQSLLMIIKDTEKHLVQADQLGAHLYKLIQNPGSLRCAVSDDRYSYR